VRVNAAGGVLVEGARPAAIPVTSLFEDREGNLWIGSARGIERLRDSSFVTYSVDEGLPGETGGPLYVDDAGRTWFAPSSGGLYWMRDGKTARVAIGGIADDPVYSISGGKGEVWVGRREGGLTHVVTKNGTLTTRTYRQSEGLAQNSVSAVHVDRQGSVWAGTLSGGVSRLRDGSFTTYTKANGLASNSVTSIAEGRDGSMWFGLRGGLSALTTAGMRSYTLKDGLPSDDVTSVTEDSQGNLWIGTSAGLALLSADRSLGIRTLDKLIPDPVLGIAEDTRGFLWIATTRHVIRLDRLRLLNGYAGPGNLRDYGITDGLPSTEGIRRERSVVSDPRGAIWFSLDRGISVIEPGEVRDELPPITQIESISADGRVIPPQTPLRIPGPSRRVAIDYTGLSLSVPQRIRFRFMLEGFDHDWSEPTFVRRAVYTNLSSGRYRFRVMSSNANVAWTESEATLPFNVDPPFWEAWWFRLLLAACAVACVWLLFTLRMRQIARRMQARLEERIQERERIARNLHDTLLQGVISASLQLDVANDRLADDSPAKPLIRRVLELMRLVTEEGRNSIRSLRSSPSESHTLEQAIAQLGEQLASNKKDVEFRVIAQGRSRFLQSATWDEAFRIASEAVTNAFRHSGAKKIEAEVEYGVRDLTLTVRDNGCGIDTHVIGKGREGHWGLPGMRERAEQVGAKLQVLSRVGSGTEVKLRIPGKVAFEPLVSTRWRKWWNRLFLHKSAAGPTSAP
jgi:signal transduction histidine kinase/streptogramin lyase